MAGTLVALLALAICTSCVAEATEEECDASQVSLLQQTIQLHRVADADSVASMKNPAGSGAKVLKNTKSSPPLETLAALDGDGYLQGSRRRRRRRSEGGSLYGSPGCPCIGVDKLKGNVTATMSDGKQVSYPVDLGAHCEAWDATTTPGCPDKGSWCLQKWCYVDPCNCKYLPALPKPSNYLPKAQYQGKPLHFSYATCGGIDSYSAEDQKQTAKDINKTCSVKVDSSKWGNDTCQCTGIGPKSGVAKVIMNNKMTDVPADIGTYCHAWEKDNDPVCSGDSPPDYCAQKWCYVDPCKCKATTSPKTSSYLPTEVSDGKPVYFSYAACGGKDSWTSSNKEACVNQKTSDDCGKLEKCAWSGAQCLGKELVNLCVAAPSESGAWSPKAIVAVTLPLLGLLY